MSRIVLREVTCQDFPLLLAWRLNAEICSSFYYQQGPFTWESLLDWVYSSDRVIRIVDYFYDEVNRYCRPVGWVELFGFASERAEVGEAIAEPALRNLDIATEMDKITWPMAIDLSKMYGFKGVKAIVSDSNLSVLGLLTKLGFVRGGSVGDGFSEYQKDIVIGQ